MQQNARCKPECCRRQASDGKAMPEFVGDDPCNPAMPGKLDDWFRGSVIAPLCLLYIQKI